MKTTLVNIAKAIPTLMEHTNLNLSLAGWPAAAAILGLCSAAVAITSIVVNGIPVQDANPS